MTQLILFLITLESLLFIFASVEILVKDTNVINHPLKMTHLKKVMPLLRTINILHCDSILYFIII